MEPFGEMHKVPESIVTIAIIEWLEHSGWDILAFDYPQSGSGVLLKSRDDWEDRDASSKGSGVIPDIIGIKDTQIIVFENKVDFRLSDFEKIASMRTSRAYEESILKLATPSTGLIILYGVGLSATKRTLSKSLNFSHLVDFVVVVDKDRHINVLFDHHRVYS
jgi:hypothetical protein